MNTLQRHETRASLRPTPIALALSIALGGIAAQPAQAMLAAPMPPSGSAPHALVRPGAAARHIVFVDARLQDWQVLTHAVRADAQVILLRPDGHELDQIARALKGRHDLASIAILSHGNRGLLQLGSTIVDTADLARYGQVLQTIKAATVPDGDILLYGCNVGAGTEGKAFIHALSNATGRVVAASTDLTGAGGNWDLEVATGRLHGESVLNSAALKGYGYDLATITVTSSADSGAGTLRNAISSATSGDTIDFSGNMTITLTSGQLSIGKNLTIDGGSNTITVDGGYRSRVFDITAGTVKLAHMTITHGVVYGNGGTGGGSYTASNGGSSLGAGISNAGTLTLDTVTVTANAATGGGGGGGVSGAYVGGGGGGGSGANSVAGGGNGGSTGSGTGSYAGVAGSGGYGGRGGSFDGVHLCGFGGTFTAGGTGGSASYNYGAGGNGAFATAGSLSIGGGGGGSGWDTTGKNGGDAAGGIYNSGTLYVIGNSPITNNLAAGGGGGGGGGSGNHGGYGGRGVGAIWNAASGTVHITATNYSAMTGNSGVSGALGGVNSTGSNTGFSSPTGVAGIYNTTGGTVDTTFIPPGPTVTDANISITSTPTGTGGVYKVGDTITAQWDNSATGDNNSGVTGVTMDFSQFGGGSAVTATNSSGIWTASYTLPSGTIDTTNLNVSVTATDGSGSTTTADTSNLSVDDQPPTVTDANISISGASGTGGAYKIGDTVTVTWNDTATGDHNTDTLAGATANFSQFGGGTAVPMTNTAGTWTATYTIASGSIDGTGKNVSVSVTDDAGNVTTTTDTTNATVDNIAPTVSDANISISGATGLGGTYKIGDVVTATWNNTAGGDNNSDTISGATVDFSQFGGGSAVAMSNNAGSWTATYVITSGAIDATNLNISVTATDNAGNQTTTADTTNASVDNVPPTVTATNIALSGATGTGGVFKTGDTVTAKWDNTATGDNNSDTISAVTVDFSQFGGGTAVAASNSGNIWTATYNLAAGVSGTNKNVSVTAVDNAGNPTTTTGTNNATVDTVAPTTSVTSAKFSNDTGISSTDLITKTASQTISGTLSAAIVSGETVQVSIDNGSTWQTASTTTTNWTLAGVTLTASNTLKVKVTDSVGNDGPVYSHAYVLDTTPPTNTVATATLSADTGTSSTDFITKTASQTISGTLTNNLASGDNVQVSTDGGTTWSTATTTVGSNTWTLSGATLSSGSNTLQIKVSDTAGNDGPVYSQAYTLDTTAPTISFNTLALSNDTGTPGDFVTSAASQTITANLSAPPAGTDIVYGSLDGGATWTNITAMVSGTSLNWTGVTLLSGTHNLELKVTDEAGNDSTPTIQSYTLNNNAPTIGFSSVSFSNDTGSSASDFITDSVSQTISATLSAPLASGDIVQGSLDSGTTWTDITSKVSGTALNWTGASLNLGNNTLELKVTSNAGSDGPVTSQTYIYDNSAPTVATNTALTVAEGGPATAFTASNLQLADTGGSGTAASDLTYTVTSLPTKGSLTLSGNPIAVNGTFTQADIDNGLLKYQPTAGQNGSDSFGFSASDTAGNTLGGQTGSMNITLLPKTYTGPLPGGGTGTASISGGGSSCGFSKAQFINVSGDPDSPPQAPPTGFNFQHGLFDFVLQNCTPGGTVTVSIDYGQSMPLNTVYWKYGPTPSPSLNPILDPNAGATPHWYQIPVTASGNTVQFAITDGQLGDDDTSNNGTIVDQGGPAVPINTAGIPALGDWAARLLALMMAGLGWFFLGKRRRRD